MKSIVNVSKNWGIGKNGKLLAEIPGDMKFFREQTKNKIVIVGLNTLKSFPGQKPLKGRINIVLTEALDQIPMESIAACDCYIDEFSDGKGLEFLHKPGATVMIACTTLPQVLEMAGLFSAKDVYVCGGASIYRLLLPYCDTALVTKNDSSDEADTFYPDLDADPDWEVAEEGDEQEENGYKYRFMTYRRKQ